MEVFFDDVLDWSALNINVIKAKEMIVWSNVISSSQLIYSNNIIEKVVYYKLLGVLINTNLKWDSYVDSICSKASSRLHFITQFKRKTVRLLKTCIISTKRWFGLSLKTLAGLGILVYLFNHPSESKLYKDVHLKLFKVQLLTTKTSAKITLIYHYLAVVSFCVNLFSVLSWTEIFAAWSKKLSDSPRITQTSPFSSRKTKNKSPIKICFI